MKKLFAIVLVVCMIFSLCACGVNTSFTKTESVTENGVTTTTTTTTTNGQTTTETHTETEGGNDVNGSLTIAETAADGETHKTPIGLYNESEKSVIVQLCVCPEGAGTHDNILDEGDSLQPNGDGLKSTLTYDFDHLVWDFSIVVEGSDEYINFKGIDVSDFDAEEGVSLHFVENEDGSWSVKG